MNSSNIQFAAKHQSVVVLLLLVVLSACTQKEVPPSAAQLPPTVKTVTVNKEALVRTFRVSGVIRPVDRADLAFQTDGVMLERLVELGDFVEAGQLLAVIRNPRLEPEESAALATVAEIRSRRDQAKRDLVRLQQLRLDKAVGEESVEQKAADVTALSAALQRAEAELAALSGLVEEASLKAPFSGEINQIFAEPGEYIRPGQVVMSLGGIDELEVQVQVPAQYANLSVGHELSVVLPTIGVQIAGTLTRQSHQGQAGTGLFPMIIQLANDVRVKVGMRADVMVPWQSAEQNLLVPLSAVVDPIGGQPRVYRVVDNQVEQLAVKLGQHRGTLIAVANDMNEAVWSPLDEGDQVVVSGHQSLTDGQKVQVLK